MTTLLVDNSVLARAPILIQRLDELATQHLLAICSPTLDEAMFSARSPTDLALIRDNLLRSFVFLPTPPSVDERIPEIRTALFAAGLGRSAGVIDVIIAAIALDHRTTVLHYDADFGHIAGVLPGFRQMWVAPAGSLQH